MPDSSNPPRRSSSRALLVGLTVVALGAVTLGGLLWIKLSNPFLRRDVKTELFSRTEFLHELKNLELAERGVTEIVEKQEVITLDVPFVGEVKSSAEYEVRFFVLYTYVIDTEGDWGFRIEDGVLLATAPRLTARPPAIDTGSIKERYDGGVLVTDEEGRLREIRNSLTAIATERAESAESIEIVRENCRKSLKDFLHKWLRLAGYDVKFVEVQFADETKLLDIPFFDDPG